MIGSGVIRRRRRGAIRSFRPQPTGYAALTPEITINGVTEQPLLCLDGDNGAATWVPKIGAANFSEALTGTSPTYRVASAVGLGTTYVNGGKCHRAANATDYNIGTSDFVIEMIFSMNQVASYEGILNKYNGTPGVNRGYTMYSDTVPSKRLGLLLRNGATSVTLTTPSNSVQPNTIYMFHAFVDRSEKGYIFLNGIEVLNASVAALDGVTLTDTSVPLGFADNGIPAYTFNGTLFHLALYSRATWMAGVATNSAEFSAIAVERYGVVTA